MPSWLLPLLICPSCRAPLALSADGDATDGMLCHASGAACSERYPLIDGVPRLLRETGRAALIAARPVWFERTEERRSLARAWSGTSRSSAVVEGFDYEWSAYGEAESKDHAAVFDLYFDLIEPAAYARDRVVLDAGCGGGRWAAQVARRGPRVIAMDLGQSVDVARRNLAGYDVGVVQADLLDTPIAAASVDWAYSLGVLHHIDDPSRALRAISATLRSGSVLLLYVYYALENRGPAFRAAFRSVDALRHLTSRLPRPMVHAFSLVAAAALYWPLGRMALLLDAVGAHDAADAWPLGMYRRRTFRTMRNDSLDRFGTRYERRFSRSALTTLMLDAGLRDVRVSPRPPYWHAIARRTG